MKKGGNKRDNHKNTPKVNKASIPKQTNKQKTVKYQIGDEEVSITTFQKCDVQLGQCQVSASILLSHASDLGPTTSAQTYKLTGAKKEHPSLHQPMNLSDVLNVCAVTSGGA